MPIYYDGGSGNGDSSNGAVTHPIYKQALAVLANGGAGAVSNAAQSTQVQKIAQALASNGRARAMHGRRFRKIMW